MSNFDPGQLAAAINPPADMTVTTTPTALPACPAVSSDGILVYAHDNNDPGSLIRVSSNADATHGVPLGPGRSFTFKVSDASQLKACLEAAANTAKLICIPA